MTLGQRGRSRSSTVFVTFGEGDIRVFTVNLCPVHSAGQQSLMMGTCVGGGVKQPRVCARDLASGVCLRWRGRNQSSTRTVLVCLLRWRVLRVVSVHEFVNKEMRQR